MTPSVRVRWVHGDETETIVDINPPSTSTVTAVTTASLPINPECSTGLTPSYSLKLNPACIRADVFADLQPARKQQSQGQSIVREVHLRETFKGGPTTRSQCIFVLCQL